MKAEALYAQVTNDLIAQIEAGAGDWNMPWRKIATGGVPRSASTGKPYKGINWWLLSLAGRSYQSPWWATFKQWKAVLPEGARILKEDQHPQDVFLWKPTERKVGDEIKKSLYATTFRVFNADQIVNPPEKYTGKAPQLNEHERHEAAEEFFGSIGAQVQEGGDRAFYASVGDYIQVPLLGQFDHPDHYYSTLAHEHVHWTGHETRLNRQLRQRFGSEAYAFEELIAEIGAAFLSAQFGLDPAVRRDHAPYLQSWLKVLKGDPKALVKAASEASKAAEYLNEAAVVTQEQQEEPAWA